MVLPKPKAIEFVVVMVLKVVAIQNTFPDFPTSLDYGAYFKL